MMNGARSGGSRIFFILLKPMKPVRAQAGPDRFLICTGMMNVEWAVFNAQWAVLNAQCLMGDYSIIEH